MELDDAVNILQDLRTDLQDALESAPDRPGYTCPDIDEAIRTLVGVSKEICKANDELLNADIWSPFFRHSPDKEVAEVIGMLEKLRKANDALRANGTHYYKALRAALDEINKRSKVEVG